MCHEVGISEERAQKAMIGQFTFSSTFPHTEFTDAARLADELRSEQENAIMYERERKLLEAQVKDIVIRYDEAEANALKVK